MQSDTNKLFNELKGLAEDMDSLRKKVAALEAENERLKASQLSLEKWIACEQAHFETADNLREKLYQASLEVERLRKAGDAMAGVVGLPLNKTQVDAHISAWNAAKEGRDAK